MSEIRSSTAARIKLQKQFLRKHQWLPRAVAIGSWLLFLWTLLWRTSEPMTLLTAGIALSGSFAWGYSNRAFRSPIGAALTHLERKQYGEVWNSLAANRELARVAVSGERDEAALRSSVETCVRNLLELTRISPEDEVLEIGCGVGRVGRELRARCKMWTGCDVSTQMLEYAKERLKGIDNVHMVALGDGDLREFAGESFDVVYATNMLGHLDEIDRWRYVEEAFRVLRPGGRLSIDNIDLESDEGWRMFANDARIFAGAKLPPYMPRFSTAAEFIAYATRAGFREVTAHRRSPLIIVIAEKVQVQEHARPPECGTWR